MIPIVRHPYSTAVLYDTLCLLRGGRLRLLAESRVSSRDPESGVPVLIGV